MAAPSTATTPMPSRTRRRNAAPVGRRVARQPQRLPAARGIAPCLVDGIRLAVGPVMSAMVRDRCRPTTRVAVTGEVSGLVAERRRATALPAGRPRAVPARSPPIAPTSAQHFGSRTGCCPRVPTPDRSMCSASARVQSSSPPPSPRCAGRRTARAGSCTSAEPPHATNPCSRTTTERSHGCELFPRRGSRPPHRGDRGRRGGIRTSSHPGHRFPACDRARDQEDRFPTAQIRCTARLGPDAARPGRGGSRTVRTQPTPGASGAGAVTHRRRCQGRMVR